MPAFSISLKRPGRTGQAKTTLTSGELAPTAGEAIEICVDTTAYPSPLAFWADLRRLLDRTRELGEPRPVRWAQEEPEEAVAWSDGTSWSDGTEWTG